MLKKALEFTHSDPNAIFGISWVLSAIIFLPNILERFRWNPPGGATDMLQFGVLVLLVMLGILAGWPVWRILRKEKYSSLRESVVVVMGFVPIQVAIFIAFGVFYEVALYPSHRGDAELPFFAVGFAISSLIGGCWIGFKKTSRTWLWCILGALFYWQPSLIELIRSPFELIDSILIWRYKDLHSFLWIALAVAGGYFGRWVSLGGNEKGTPAEVV